MTIVKYHNKCIAVLGFGVEGKAVVDYFYINYPQQDIFVIDENIKTTEDYNNINFITGENCLDCLVEFDIVFISPGISIYRNELQRAKESGVLFSSATQLWYDNHKQDKNIFVTGTKGKSTTSSMLYHVLNKLHDNVHLIGNIGIPAVDKIDISLDNTIWVVELSSFQSAILNANTDISVLLNLYPEHIDWHGSIEQYYRDKLRILSTSETKIINYKNQEIVNDLLGKTSAIYFNDSFSIHHKDNTIYKKNKLLSTIKYSSLKGSHNLDNLCAMLCVTDQMGIDCSYAIELLNDYVALPHRMEEFATVDGVTFIDDSISTIPQSAIQAINCYKNKHTTLILGGLDRGLDWDEFSIWLAASSINNIIGLPDTGHIIVDAIRSKSNRIVIQLFTVDNLQDAVTIAKKITPKEGVVLLSPASPSQNKYRDYKERGTLFKHFVLQ